MSRRESASFWQFWAAGLLLAAGGAASAGAQEARCPDGDVRVARVEIAFDRAAGTISVEPAEVVIYKPGAAGEALRVCWTVSGLGAKEELRFVAKDSEDDGYFPALNRVVKAVNPFANSGNPAKLGQWAYGVIVVDENGATLAELDPIVIIKGDSGLSGG